ncbi:MAG: Mov34/MPN/PAD-1 family protein [Phenylobacterium sp.]|uniref:Mov34/MPN/PAD-1 family protein n=1 Tax=Phenylobacterium sp. TaxID=1871053 RepID=UPI003BB560CB
MKPGLYSDVEGRFQVLLEESALTRALTLACASGQNETGGVLVGRYEDGGAVAVVEEVTGSPRGSIFSGVTFHRAAGNLRAKLLRRWSSKRHYLGEWHFHPGHSPDPSGRDTSTMARIAADKRYSCREPLLLILGQSPAGEPRLSLHVFPLGEAIAPLRAR